MKRPYANGMGNGEVEAFVGREAGSTPASGMTTLFVVGKLSIPRISDYVDEAQDFVQQRGGLPHLKHLYFGANHSFDGEKVSEWTSVIKHFLREGFWCTLDFKPSQISLIQMTGLCRHGRFIPLVSIRLPSVYALGNNATLKVDDVAQGATNPGYWCVPIREVLLHPDRLSQWPKLHSDSPLTLKD